MPRTLKSKANFKEQKEQFSVGIFAKKIIFPPLLHSAVFRLASLRLPAPSRRLYL
jgi:hypothetical protein